MKKIVAGILAHVDAGKTTLSEGILWKSGTIRNAGRVDNGDTFLDTFYLEKERGITIFSKQAEMLWGETGITLLDTPGHVDFSAEMERTLSVIDYAILVISGTEGIQGHTATLWKLLDQYEIPVFIFINKMDIQGADKDRIITEIKRKLSDRCMEFTAVGVDAENKIVIKDNRKNSQTESELKENISVCDELIMEKYLDTEDVEGCDVREAIANRRIFPCFFGSALKLQGIEEFLNAFDLFTQQKRYSEYFGATVYKISRDDKNNRLTHMKITGGCLNTKDYIERYDEKVNQIRIYSGNKYETVQQVRAGDICAVTGISHSRAGDIIGNNNTDTVPVLEPVMTYRLELEEGENVSEAFKNIKELEEELPELSIEWNDVTNDISIKVMGEVQIEILRNIINDRFGLNVNFGTGHIVYKETIRNRVYGVGHYEPLKHYAEVHLLMEPGERGSGIQVSVECSEDELAKHWQRLIIIHIEEKVHMGVLTGSPVTDLRIILKGGRAHTKHTEGGDFRQATYRAVRQGLMQADSIVLEPYYDFRLFIPSSSVGRAMTDLEQLKAHFQMPDNLGEMSVITGYAPVSLMQDYALKVSAYTKGQGQFICSFRGYDECHNQDEVVEKIGYDVYADVANSPDSVFCAHGAGYIVPWYEVQEHMHVESKFVDEKQSFREQGLDRGGNMEYLSRVRADMAADKQDERSGYERDKELEEIFIRTFGSKNIKKEKDRTQMFKKPVSDKPYVYHPVKHKDKYLLVDGYNIIYAWQELRELAIINMDSARDRLLDIMSNYQGYRKINLMVVFDAYKVKGFAGEKSMNNNICVVFTKEAETADAYIEKFAHNNSKKFDITVATSDGLEQIIITGQGCNLISAREFEAEVQRTNELIRENYLSEKQNVYERIVVEEHKSSNE